MDITRIRRRLSQRFGAWFGVWRLAVWLNKKMGFHSVGESPLFGDNNPEFVRLMEIVRPRTLVTQDKCFVLDRCLRHALGVMPAGSAVAECGVFKGGTAYLLASILQGRGIPLHLFDTFSGIPESSGCDATAVGDLANTSVESVRRFLKPFDLVDFHPGLIPDTFAGLKEQQFGFVHVDVDTYRTTVHCCEYFWPRLLPGGVMVFDDYVLPGQRQAVDEFFASRTEVPMPMRSGQAMVVRHPRPVQ